MEKLQGPRKLYPDLPVNPNLSQALGSTAPVITTLLGGISTATFVAVIEGDFQSKCMAILPFYLGSREATMVFGIISTSFFVLATIALVFRYALDVESLSEDQKNIILDNAKVNKNHRTLVLDYYKNKSYNNWVFAEEFSTLGISFLFFTLGAFVYGYVAWASFILGILGVTLLFVSIVRLMTILCRTIRNLLQPQGGVKRRGA